MVHHIHLTNPIILISVEKNLVQHQEPQVVHIVVKINILSARAVIPFRGIKACPRTVTRLPSRVLALIHQYQNLPVEAAPDLYQGKVPLKEQGREAEVLVITE